MALICPVDYLEVYTKLSQYNIIFSSTSNYGCTVKLFSVFVVSFMIVGRLKVSKKSSEKSSEVILEATWRPHLHLRHLKRVRFLFRRSNGPVLPNHFEEVDFVQRLAVDLAGPIRFLSLDQSRRMFSGLSKSGPRPQLAFGWKVWALGFMLGNQLNHRSIVNKALAFQCMLSYDYYHSLIS